MQQHWNNQKLVYYNFVTEITCRSVIIPKFNERQSAHHHHQNHHTQYFHHVELNIQQFRRNTPSLPISSMSRGLLNAAVTALPSIVLSYQPTAHAPYSKLTKHKMLSLSKSNLNALYTGMDKWVQVMLTQQMQ